MKRKSKQQSRMDSNRKRKFKISMEMSKLKKSEILKMVKKEIK